MRRNTLFFPATIVFAALLWALPAPAGSSDAGIPRGQMNFPDSPETRAVLSQKYLIDAEKISDLKKKVYEVIVQTDDPYSVCFSSGVVFETNGRLVIITANHTLDKNGRQKTITARDHAGQLFSCTIAASIPKNDITVLTIEDPQKIAPETVVRSLEKAEIGEMIYACGYYSGIAFVKIGKIIRFEKKILTDTSPVYNTILSDAQIGHGFSGGPALNEKGQLVGIIVAMDPETHFSDISSFENIEKILNTELSR
jgi:S1-C subfamily serine protease